MGVSVALFRSATGMCGAAFRVFRPFGPSACQPLTFRPVVVFSGCAPLAPSPHCLGLPQHAVAQMVAPAVQKSSRCISVADIVATASTSKHISRCSSFMLFDFALLKLNSQNTEFFTTLRYSSTQLHPKYVASMAPRPAWSCGFAQLHRNIAHTEVGRKLRHADAAFHLLHFAPANPWR